MKYKVKIFEATNTVLLTKELTKFFDNDVKKLINIDYTIFAGRYSVMVVYV